MKEHKEKGVDLFCESVTRLNKNGTVIGDGPLKNELEQIPEKIIFLK